MLPLLKSITIFYVWLHPSLLTFNYSRSIRHKNLEIKLINWHVFKKVEMNKAGEEDRKIQESKLIFLVENMDNTYGK